MRSQGNAKGIITTVAGDGTYGSMYTGEGGPATKATIFPESVAVDASGNLYIADAQDNRICKVDQGGIITTVAGGGSQVYTWYEGPATNAVLNQPTSVAVDASGNLYIADSRNNCVRKVNASGIMTTVAGNNGSQGYSGDGGRADMAMLNNPTGVAVDASGNLYIADEDNYRVRKVDASGTITTVAGNSIPNYSGDGGPATSAAIFPESVSVDASGNLYITVTNAIREVTAPIPSSSATEQTAIIFTVGQPSYTVGGQSFAMDAPPFISNGHVLVPARYLADALGAQTSWEASGTVQKVIITRGAGATEVSLTIGSTTMESSINQDNTATIIKTSQMDVAPVIKNSRTYLPARYVTDVFGCTITWNEASQTITVSPESP